MQQCMPYFSHRPNTLNNDETQKTKTVALTTSTSTSTSTASPLRGLLQDAVVDDDAGVLVIRKGLVERDRERGANYELLHRGGVGGEVGPDAEVVCDQASDIYNTRPLVFLQEREIDFSATHEDRPSTFRKWC